MNSEQAMVQKKSGVRIRNVQNIYLATSVRTKTLVQTLAIEIVVILPGNNSRSF